MATLKLVEWNMEWLNELFEPNSVGAAQFRPDATVPPTTREGTVGQRVHDLIGVVTELDPDLMVVIEGPDRQSELQALFDKMPGTWTTALQMTKGSQQNVGIAVRTDTGKFDPVPIIQHDTAVMSAFDAFSFDTDDDGILETYRFERRPLYVEIAPLGAPHFHVMGLHLKSKGIFTAYEWSKWWQIADAARRKILAETTQLRLKFIDPFLSDPMTRQTPFLICGDINDGPGLDASEKRLFGSGIERLMGTIWKPQLCLSNALFDTLSDNAKANLDFSSLATTNFADPIFNNVWQNEWIDHVLYSNNQAAQWVTNAKIMETMPSGEKIWKKYKFASDHYPVQVTVNL